MRTFIFGEGPNPLSVTANSRDEAVRIMQERCNPKPIDWKGVGELRTRSQNDIKKEVTLVFQRGK